MATMLEQAEMVKASLKDGTTSSTTLNALQHLLDLGLAQTTPQAKSSRSTQTASKTTRKTIEKASRAANRKANQAQSATVHEDVLPQLSPREKYALATETANAALKILSESLKSPTNGTMKALESPKKSTTEQVSQRALKARSGNITPSKTSTTVQKPLARLSSSNSAATSRNTESHIVATAECAHIAFSFLRSTDPSKFGAREMPLLQLENGMLALAGRMIAHGLESMALRELRIVKRRLEANFPVLRPVKTHRAPSAAPCQAPEKETLAGLMHLDVDLHTSNEAVVVAITYHSHVLRIVSASRKPAVIDELLQYLQIEAPNSIVNLILRQIKQDSDSAKSLKQLEQLSQTLLALCPSISSSADEYAADPSLSPTPQTVFEVQVLALQIRKLWWRRSNHEADIPKELVEPLHKCAAAFSRRASSKQDAATTYECLNRCIDSLGPFDSAAAGESLFNIHFLLHSKAATANLDKETRNWADQMLLDCASLEENHVRRVVCAVNNLDSTLKRKSFASDQSNIAIISDLLCSKLTGSSPDYDLLMSSLATLNRNLESREPQTAAAPTTRLTGIIAGFALRYYRSYPSMNTSSVQSVLNTAMRISGSIDDMLTWVTEDAAKFYIDQGALKAAAQTAASRSLLSAWSCSIAAISLSRILRVLVIRAVRKPVVTSTPVFDVECLDTLERGMLFEIQLRYCLDLAVRSKHFNALQKMVQELLDHLSKIYTSTEYPIRRARVAGVVFRMRECNIGLLSDKHLKAWQDTDLGSENELGDDAGLRGFLNDARAELDVARAFSDGQPSTEDLKPSLKEWERIIDKLQDRNDAHKYIEDPQSLIQHLSSIATYFNAIGEDSACLATQVLWFNLNRIVEDRDSQLCFATVDLARQHLQVGYSSKAGMILTQVLSALEQQRTHPLVNLDFQVAYAGYLLDVDRLDECRSALEVSRNWRSRLQPQNVSREERRRYELLHAQAWFIQSKYLLETGSPHESLGAAKKSVRLMSGIWSSLERSDSNRKSNPVPDFDNGYPPQSTKERTGVSKLQLTPNENDQSARAEEQSTKGAAFWPLVRPLCTALLHLSDVYSHHGLYNESIYYSERAIHIAESVGSTQLLLRIRSHRSQLLTLADRMEEAELCLTQGDSSNYSEASQALIQYKCAQAAIKEKEGSLDEAADLYRKAEDLLDGLAVEDHLQKMERIDSNDGDLESCMASLSICSTDPSLSGNVRNSETQAASGRLKAPEKKTGSRTAKSGGDPRAVPKPEADSRDLAKTNYVFQKLRADINLRRALLDVRRGKDVQLALNEVQRECASTALMLQRRPLVYNELLRKAMMALQMDVTLNILPESTLSIPATMDDDRSRSSKATKTCRVAKKPSGKMARKKEPSDNQFADLLRAAKESLLRERWRSDSLHSTIQTHVESSQLLNATMLLSAMSGLDSCQDFRELDQTLAIDLPRIKALQYEKGAMAMDDQSSDATDFLAWPCHNSDTKASPTLTAEAFQDTFVDILPRTWTAVSLCLNEDGSELYVARYRSGQAPFILRLPFSRNKSDELSEDAFGYHTGKAELHDIIEQSNYSCHNPGALDVKGTKTKWWNERYALDLRMQELLINVENIWFGGFKSIFAQQRLRIDLLAAFRTSFESTLNRHLPSRKAAKESSNFVSLHDQVLELFIGLGDDNDEGVDLDDPLADLLYFVVDLLQFKGERNAYDEIDFDTMAVDVLDALRVYHSACNDTTEDIQHLILVLDRRLQAFPWESLPCLEEANVSRVGSLLSLREKIMAQRALRSGGPADGIVTRPIVKRTEGTYILNPGSDLKGTQTTLEPVLSKLCGGESGDWTGIVNAEPDEGRFSSALKDSSMLLYFGHGAGSQYIRPRTIKKLERCCDVVWLIGCSSGAVNEYGAFEPCAIPLCYLLAGEGLQSDLEDHSGTCKAVVAALWDVTDKDVDRFSLVLGEEWGLWPAQEGPKVPSKMPRKRDILAALPSTPQQVPKTPKTPKVVQTPAAFKTPIRDRSRPAKRTGGKQSLVEAVRRSRSACHLRYLNGAAPVVYGIPIYLDD